MNLKIYFCVVALLIISSIAEAQIKETHMNNALNTDKRIEKMSRVTGIGGVFIKAEDPVMLRNWYKTHLGIDVQVWGGTSFRWVDESGKPYAGTTAWMIGDGENFAPSKSPYMVNYRVSDLNALLAALRAEGCNVLEKTDESEYGKFGWVIDPEGNKIELWEPPVGE